MRHINGLAKIIRFLFIEMAKAEGVDSNMISYIQSVAEKNECRLLDGIVTLSTTDGASRRNGGPALFTRGE
jgi:hypothetical protein